MIRDLYDNSIVAYKTASHQTVSLVLDTIRLAMKPSEIALLQYRERQTGQDSRLNPRITAPQTLLSFSITEEEAEAYCHSIGMKFFHKKWQDKTVIIRI